MARAMSAATTARPPTPTQLQAVRDARRGDNRIRRLHHHAVRTDDMEATRRFYEEVLGMPMVSALKENHGAGTDREDPFVHCFFEMADGGCLAFFQFLPGARGPADKLPKDAIDHHIAMAVERFDDIIRLKEKLEAHGYPSCGIDHGFCYSLYARDPNGMMVEFVCDCADELETNEAAAATAHDDLIAWRRGDYAPNNLKRGGGNFPLPTSPREEVMKVLGLDPKK
jgi:glyoxylase I family protein